MTDLAELIGRIPEGCTPGPWTVDADLLRDGHIAVMAGFYGIAKVWNVEAGNNARNDAILISLAPELAAALTRLRSALEAEIAHCDKQARETDTWYASLAYQALATRLRAILQPPSDGGTCG